MEDSRLNGPQNFDGQDEELAFNTKGQLPELERNAEPPQLERSPEQSLAKLEDFLNAEIPEQVTAQDLSNAAHELIDKFNAKRKIDTMILEQYKQTLESQVSKQIEEMEQHMYGVHEAISAEVEKRLQELFSCVNKIATAEGEIENFRESLRMFYQEMHNI